MNQLLGLRASSSWSSSPPHSSIERKRKMWRWREFKDWWLANVWLWSSGDSVMRALGYRSNPNTRSLSKASSKYSWGSALWVQLLFKFGYAKKKKKTQKVYFSMMLEILQQTLIWHEQKWIVIRTALRAVLVLQLGPNFQELDQNQMIQQNPIDLATISRRQSFFSCSLDSCAHACPGLIMSVYGNNNTNTKVTIRGI